MVDFPNLNRTYSNKSSISVTPNLRIVQFGDGYKQVQAAGINHISRRYTIIYEMLDTTDANTLRDFLLTYSDGTPVTIRLYNIDPTGNTVGNYFILNFSESNSTVSTMWDFTIELEEIFDDTGD